MQNGSAEEVAQLWGNLFFSTERAAPRSLLVTSAVGQEGATQIAAALAMVGAESNHELRVVLADFNLRRPRIAGVLGLSESPGVTDILDGRSPLAGACRSLQLPNGNVLQVLPAGTPADHPLGLLKTRQVQSLVGQLKERCDHVIIDVACVNKYPDAQVVGTLVDGALLVVKAGQTARETVAEAKKRLDLAGVRCLGVVLNQRKDPIPAVLYRAT